MRLFHKKKSQSGNNDNLVTVGIRELFTLGAAVCVCVCVHFLINMHLLATSSARLCHSEFAVSAVLSLVVVVETKPLLQLHPDYLRVRVYFPLTDALLLVGI